VLCSWARHLALTVPLSTQEYKWVPGSCWGNPNKLRGSDLRWTTSYPGGRNIPSPFKLQKPGSAPAAMSQLAPRLHTLNYKRDNNNKKKLCLKTAILIDSFPNKQAHIVFWKPRRIGVILQLPCINDGCGHRRTYP